jgi:hypothetical protein
VISLSNKIEYTGNNVVKIGGYSMKYRESGMPDEEMWSGFFNILHGEEPLQLLASVHELLVVGVIFKKI